MKSLLFVAFIPLAFQSFGQLTKGNWLIGGAGSFYNYNEDYRTPTSNITSRWTSIDLSASVGYFFIEKFSAGVRPYFSSLKGESSGGGSTNYYRLAIGPFARYYLLQTEKQFNLLADVSYQLGVNKFLGALHEQGKFNTFSIMAGPEIFFNTVAGIEILLGYTQKIISIENSPNESYSNKKGLQLSIGLTLHLEKD